MGIGHAYLERFGEGEALRTELAAITARLQDTKLQRTDRMTWAHGLEGRVPFLDIELVRYVFSVPPAVSPELVGRTRDRTAAAEA